MKQAQQTSPHPLTTPNRSADCSGRFMRKLRGIGRGGRVSPLTGGGEKIIMLRRFRVTQMKRNAMQSLVRKAAGRAEEKPPSNMVEKPATATEAGA